MGISKFLRDIESEDGMVCLTRQQADDISDELDKTTRLIRGLVSAFKRAAACYLIRLQWQKEYCDANDYLKSLGGDNDNT